MARLGPGAAQSPMRNSQVAPGRKILYINIIDMFNSTSCEAPQPAHRPERRPGIEPIAEIRIVAQLLP